MLIGSAMCACSQNISKKRLCTYMSYISVPHQPSLAQTSAANLAHHLQLQVGSASARKLAKQYFRLLGSGSYPRALYAGWGKHMRARKCLRVNVTSVGLYATTAMWWVSKTSTLTCCLQHM
jgi:hypothetical protein